MNELSCTEWNSMTDKALHETIGVFVQHHRLNQNKSQDIVADDAGISRSTISLLERGKSISLGSLIKVLRVLDLLYIMEAFKVENEISPIEYAKLQKKKRKRSRPKSDDSNSSIFTSGDPQW